MGLVSAKKIRQRRLNALDTKKTPSKNMSSKSTQALISRFHTLNKKLAACKDPSEQARIKEEINSLGGLDSYQKASLLGQSKQRGGDSSRWLMQNLLPATAVSDDKRKPHRLLDVGALKNNYKFDKFIQPRCIDLNSQCAEIEAIDFMDFVDDVRFDILCLSLVLNFVPTPLGRGQMLKKCRQHLSVGGYLYIVLPLSCTSNSRYMTREHMLALLKCLGFSLVKFHESDKLLYMLLQMEDTVTEDLQFTVKKEIKAGGGRNNFAITLD